MFLIEIYISGFESGIFGPAQDGSPGSDVLPILAPAPTLRYLGSGYDLSLILAPNPKACLEKSIKSILLYPKQEGCFRLTNRGKITCDPNRWKIPVDNS